MFLELIDECIILEIINNLKSKMSSEYDEIPTKNSKGFSKL